MYGGGTHPDERHGLQVLAAYRVQSFNYFSTLQYIKSQRRYFSATDYTIAGLAEAAPDNGLSYSLQSISTSIGVRYSDYSKVGAAFEFSLGWQNNLVLSQRDVRFAPANFTRSDGHIFSVSAILPLGSGIQFDSFQDIIP